MPFLVLLTLLVVSWGAMLLISFWDAFLLGLFLGWSGVPALAALTYWQLFWLNMAAMMPIGTAVGLALAMHNVVD